MSTDNLIFGHSWEEIQALQQRKPLPPRHAAAPSMDSSLDKDVEMLRQHGIDGLKERQYFGVIDRLQRSGHLRADEAGVQDVSPVQEADQETSRDDCSFGQAPG